MRIVDENDNGSIPLHEAEIFCAALEQLGAEQQASDLRDLYAESTEMEVPVSIFALPVALAAFQFCAAHIISEDNGDDHSALKQDLTEEQMSYGYQLIKS